MRRSRIRPLILGLCLAAAGWLVGCASSPKVNDAPLSESSEQELKNTLIGTWEHTHTITESGQREPVEKATVTWTFKKDGTGTQMQKLADSDEINSRPFEWELDGRNIILDQTDTNQKAFYRADTWSPQQMQWYNYMAEKSYVVRKQQ